MQKKIAVIGAGAIGSSVSADLTKAGLDVTVVDQWPAQVEKVRTDGIEVTMPDGVVKTIQNTYVDGTALPYDEFALPSALVFDGSGNLYVAKNEVGIRSYIVKYRPLD